VGLFALAEDADGVVGAAAAAGTGAVALRELDGNGTSLRRPETRWRPYLGLLEAAAVAGLADALAHMVGRRVRGRTGGGHWGR
jgi:hypothetical protein